MTDRVAGCMTSAELVQVYARLEGIRSQLWGVAEEVPRLREHVREAAAFVLEAQLDLRLDIGQAVLDEVRVL